MSNWPAKQTKFWVKVSQKYTIDTPTVVEAYLTAKEVEGEYDFLEDCERIVEVVIDFPENFFKPVRHTAVVRANEPEAMETLMGYYSAGGYTPTVKDDTHVAFPDN